MTSLADLKRARLKAWRAANPDLVREQNARHHRSRYARHSESLKARTARKHRENAAEAKARRAGERMHLDAVNEMGAAMTYEEIAAEMGISKARVGQLVAQALRKLSERFPELLELITAS